MRLSRIVRWVLGGAILVLIGCGDEPAIQSYTASPSPPASENPGALAHHPSAGHSAAPGTQESSLAYRYTTPPQWARRPDPGAMRLATYLLPGDTGAEMSVSIVGGTLLDNVNRWHRQLNLDPIGRVDPQTLETVASPAGDVMIIDLAGSLDAQGEPTMRYRIGMIADRASTNTWFFKLLGQPDVVEAHAHAFDAMLRTLCLEGDTEVKPGVDPEVAAGDPAPAEGAGNEAAEVQP